MAKEKAAVKCEGRFAQLRMYLYNEALPMVVGDRKKITESDLIDVWDLIKEDVVELDPKDPYYNSKHDLFFQKKDTVRTCPHLDSLSLAPLIECPNFQLDKSVVENYLLSLGNSANLSKQLSLFSEPNENYLEKTLSMHTKDIVLGKNQNLKNYILSSNYGVGTIVSGGAKGGGVRSDSPFLFGVYEMQNKDLNLACLLGFWAQNNEMLVSQIQPCKNGHLPSEITLGEGAFAITTELARKIGFEKVITYTARSHPIFMEHPNDWNQFGGDFVCIYDNGAKKNGFNGGRHEDRHEKDLTFNSQHL